MNDYFDLVSKRVAEFRRLRVWLVLLLIGNLAVSAVNAWMLWGR